MQATNKRPEEENNKILAQSKIIKFTASFQNYNKETATQGQPTPQNK